jgi:uncharacterized protein YacL
MQLSSNFARVFFLLLSVFFVTSYSVGVMGPSPAAFGVGGALGALFAGVIVGIEMLFKRFSFRSFNVVAIGLFFGYLMGQVLVLMYDALPLPGSDLSRIGLFLFGSFLGVMMALRASNEIHLSIPFLKFSQGGHRVRDLLLDHSVLADPRLIDLCSTGLLDGRLVIPRFVVRDLYAHLEHPNESVRTEMRQALAVIGKLEDGRELQLRFSDDDFPEVGDVSAKLMRLSRLLDADILSAEMGKVQMAETEGVRAISLYDLSSALKPINESGEMLEVKIQRYGKEPRQGVGYLTDGTMVVVNGGGEFVGADVQAQVLSVKHSSAGRMIFCNVIDELAPVRGH